MAPGRWRFHLWLGWIASQTILFSQVFAKDDTCYKGMSFMDTFEGKALYNHTIKTLSTADDLMCQSKCFIDNRCISYSFDNKFKICNLSESDHVMHPEHFVDTPNAIYRRAENDCNCPSKAMICRVNFVHNTYRCECKAGFTGTNCDIEINECNSNPCQNGGSCINGINHYNCSCAEYFQGKNCETRVCLNGGTCTYVKDSTYCNCHDVYIGGHCEIKGEYIQVNTPGTPVCFGARDDSYGAFSIPVACNVARFRFRYVSGPGVTWNTNRGHYGYWGSISSSDGLEYLLVFVTDKNNKKISPLFLDKYQLPGYSIKSEWLNLSHIVPPQAVSAGTEFRVWFLQDLMNYSEDNNAGTTCTDIWVLKY